MPKNRRSSKKEAVTVVRSRTRSQCQILNHTQNDSTEIADDSFDLPTGELVNGSDACSYREVDTSSMSIQEDEETVVIIEQEEQDDDDHENSNEEQKTATSLDSDTVEIMMVTDSKSDELDLDCVEKEFEATPETLELYLKNNMLFVMQSPHENSKNEATNNDKNTKEEVLYNNDMATSLKNDESSQSQNLPDPKESDSNSYIVPIIQETDVNDESNQSVSRENPASEIISNGNCNVQQPIKMEENIPEERNFKFEPLEVLNDGIDHIKLSIESMTIEKKVATDSTKILPLKADVENNGITMASENDSNSGTQPIVIQNETDISSSLSEEGMVKMEKILNDVIDKKSPEVTPNIRRSNRIKTISKTKQRSKGHGLVRDKDKLLKNSQALIEKIIIPQQLPDTKASPICTPSLSPCFDSSKPMKVKSRWRRSSEIELGISELLSEDLENIKEEAIKTEEENREELEKKEQFEREMEEKLRQFITIKENVYHCEKNISKEAKKMVCDCFLTNEETERGELGCGEDCLNRLLMIECGSRCNVGDRCTNRRFQKNQYAGCNVFRTEKKGFGIMATEVIGCGEFIMEYVGEVLNSKQFQKRANAYSKDKNKHYYFMALRSDAVIDATTKGNISRFINHSCDPNAETQKWTVNGELRIGFFSKRIIVPGEEITFDYQFQRYGKEAQKCYCEADNCRGWIGEEPDSSDEEGDEDEDDVDEEEDEDENENELKEKKGFSESVQSDIGLDSSKKLSDGSMKKKDGRKKKPISRKRSYKKKRPEILDDPDLDDEIDILLKTGLKNQSHTLKLSRLMVRAKLLDARRRLLSLLFRGEMPCRRLFLDYHGLRLLYGWMHDSISIEESCIGLQFRKEILETLDSLPIPNKTMLKDSKVLSMVEKWSIKIEQNSSINNGPSTGTTSPPDDSPEPSADASPNNEVTNPPEISVPSGIEQIYCEDKDSPLIAIVPSNDVQNCEDEPKSPMIHVPTEAEVQDEEQRQTEINKRILKHDINVLAQILKEKWVNLPEVFRIPKKERIEQMKEHEREADLKYMALGLHQEEEDLLADRRNARYKERTRDNDKKKEYKEKRSTTLATDTEDLKLSKNQRRRLFAMQVAEQEAEKRRMEEWSYHEFRCTYFGLNPYKTAPEDVPSWVDPATGEWFRYDLSQVDVPPSYAHIPVPEPVVSTNIEDYDLPEMDLPEGWEFALDTKGRIYYYHQKIRISQWEPPIKILPLAEQMQTETATLTEDAHNPSENESDTDTTDTTDTVDTSEEELERKIRRIKKLKSIGIDSSILSKLRLNTVSTKESKLEEVDEEATTSTDRKKRRRKSHRFGLTEEREISPRREEDKLHSQIEMKRYKETKEKLRRKKEAAKRKKALTENKVLSNSNESDPVLDIPTTEDKPGSDDDQSSKVDADTSLLCGSTANPLIEKIVLGNSVVDELDEPLKNDDIVKRPRISKKIRIETSRKRTAKHKVKAAKKHRPDEDSPSDNSSTQARKIKEKFRSNIAGIIVHHLNPYFKETCEIGRISNNDDFKHLARKLTHFVMLKELKHCHNVNDLNVTESVKLKSKEFIKKYMAKFGEVYVRPENEPDFKD